MGSLTMVFLKVSKRLALACAVEVRKKTGIIPLISYIEHPSRNPEEYLMPQTPTLVLTGFEYPSYLNLQNRLAVVSLSGFFEIESFNKLWQVMEDSIYCIIQKGG
ncbi:MAG: hypothetical protein ABDH18_02820 [Aquificaceae bacterium]